MSIRRAKAVVMMALLGVAGPAFSQNLNSSQVGPQPDGSILVPTNQFVTPAGVQININGRPLAVAVRPDQKTAAVLNSGAVGPGMALIPVSPVVIVDLASGLVKQQFTTTDARGSYDGLIYSRDGKRLYFSQDDGQVTIADVAADGTLTLNSQIVLPPSPNHDGGPPNDVILPAASVGMNNGGIALSADQETLYVVFNTANTLGVIDLSTNTVTGQIAVGNAPKSVVISGNYAYVTNEGGRVAKRGDFTVPSDATHIVADRQSASSTTGTVSVVDLATEKTIASIAVGLHPTAILAYEDYIFVANTNSDSISIIDASNRRMLTEWIRPFEHAPFGSSPNGLAMTSQNDLIVSLGANNAVAVYKWSPRADLAFEGFIPTGWYPSSVALVERERPKSTHREEGRDFDQDFKPYESLLIANLKGIAVGSSVPDEASSDSNTLKGKATHTETGSISIVPLPNGEQLRNYTEQVVANNSWDQEHSEGDRFSMPFKTGAIKHVFYVVKENRTYDGVLGDDPRGNGDPALALFGGDDSPNHHALADDFVLFDNFYDSSLMSADGHQWVTQGLAPDYIEKSVSSFNRGYPFNGGDSLAYLPTGFIWMNALNHGKTVKIYGEYANNFKGPSQQFGTFTDWYNDSLILEHKKTGSLHAPLGTFQQTSDIPSVDQHLNRDFPTFNLSIPDQYRMDIFLKDFNSYVKNNDLPNLVVMTLCADHTVTLAGYPTPAAGMADNDLALGRLVDAVSHSRYWSSSAILVVEDDSQNGVDHVDGHRSVAYVISPYVERGQVNHTYYTQVNMVRTVEELLGLPPMNQHDALAPPITDAFQSQPNLTPYSAIQNKVSLDTVTPAPVSQLQRAWQKELAKSFPSGPRQDPDRADPNLLNRAIWYAMKNYSVPYPGDKRVLFPGEVKTDSAKLDKD